MCCLGLFSESVKHSLRQGGRFGQYLTYSSRALATLKIDIRVFMFVLLKIDIRALPVTEIYRVGIKEGKFSLS